MKDVAGDGNSLNGPHVRALKIAIVVMSILIVAGLLAVIARIIYLAGKPKAQPGSAGTTAILSEPRLALPAGATVRTISFSGDRLAVHYDAPGGAGIAVLDLESGKILSRIQIVPEAPRN